MHAHACMCTLTHKHNVHTPTYAQKNYCHMFIDDCKRPATAIT